MNEIITQLIASAIDDKKIPGLDYFDMEDRPNGAFHIVLNDGSVIKVRVSIYENSQKNKCPHCGCAEFHNPYDQNAMLCECNKCGGSWYDTSVPNAAKYAKSKYIVPADMYPCVDKLRQSLFDNPCCINEGDNGVHFFSDYELFLAIVNITPLINKSPCDQ